MTHRPESPPRIALIGLGNAGQALLRALARHWPVEVFDLAPERRREVARIGPHPPLVADSAAEAVMGANLVLLSLPTPSHCGQ